MNNHLIGIVTALLLVAAGGVCAQSISISPSPIRAPTRVTGTPVATASATTTPSARPTTAKDDKTEAAVEELKEKIESKVSKLKENGKHRAGYVTEVKGSKLRVQTESGDVQVELDSDVTEAFRIDGTKAAELKTSDIKKGDYIIVVGPEIGTSITANKVYVDQQYLVRSGKIIEVNSDSFYIKVQTLEKDIYTLDIERSTVQQLMDIKTLELSKVGFSKLKEGDSIHFTAKRGMDLKQLRFSALRTIIIPQEYFIKE